MWNRAELKSGAKSVLRGTYGQAFLVSLLATVICNIFSTVDLIMKWDLLHSKSLLQTDVMEYVNKMEIERTVAFLGFFFVIFVGYPITIGLARFFVHNHSGEGDSNDLFSVFSRSYGSRVGAIFSTSLFIFLWGLLLIVPGIIKYFEYILVPYILSDSPEMPGGRARELSRMLTDGQKGSIFVLILSFLGWYALGLVCAGVGILFVNPYYRATMAELYVTLRDTAARDGRLDPAELGLPSGAPEPGAAV